MASFPGFTGALSLLQAQAASFMKGTEISVESTMERITKDREIQRLLIKAWNAEGERRIASAKKSFLA